MYMYKQDLAFNNLQGLICHKNQPTKPLIKVTQHLLLKIMTI